MIFFSLISTAISSIFYGILITAVIMIILYAILKSINDGIVRSILFYATGVILAVLLVIQNSLIVGAMQAKDTTEAVYIYLNQILEDYSGTVCAQDSQEVFDKVTERFPLIATFIGYTDFSGHEISELPDVMTSTINDFFTSYILHRVLWILGFILIGCFIPMLYDKRSAKATRRSRVRYSRHNKYDDF